MSPPCRLCFFFSSRRRHTRLQGDWSSDVCSSDLFTEMVEIVFEHGGTLDKFIGDAIMALWGAPIAHEDDADRAMQSALDQLTALERLKDRKSTRLNSSHLVISYAVFCLKKKKKKHDTLTTQKTCTPVTS